MKRYNNDKKRMFLSEETSYINEMLNETRMKELNKIDEKNKKEDLNKQETEKNDEDDEYEKFTDDYFEPIVYEKK